MLQGLVVLAVGLGMTWLAVLGWRHRHQESVSIAEVVILQTTGAEPLPLTRFDRLLQRFQIIMMSLFGPLAVLIGLLLLLA